MTDRMPAIFVGHGNPMNAVQDNSYTRAWRRMARQIPRPHAVLAVSAHWFIPELAATISRTPRTIHDFGGFPRELYEVQYPAPGMPELASRVAALLKPLVLHAYAWGRHAREPYDWALRFEKKARELILSGDIQPLVDYEGLGPDAVLSVPTPDHFLPLLYVLGARRSDDEITFPVEGVDGGSVSMLTVRVG